MKLFKRRGSDDSEIDRAAERFLRKWKAKSESMEQEVEEQEPEAHTRDELQDMSVGDLWQIATNLEIPRKGKESSINMILEAQKAKHLNRELTEFEEIRKGSRTELKPEGKSVLIVDDNPDILESFKFILESEGYSVDTARTSQEAVEKSENRFFNVALLDIKLPDMEGTELIKILRPKMARIIMTGYPSSDNAVKSLDLGADAYLRKPIDPHNLAQVVEGKMKDQQVWESLDSIVNSALSLLEK